MLSKRKTIVGSVSLLLLLWLMGREGMGVWMPVQTAFAQARVDPVFTTLNTAFGFFLTFTHYLLYIFVTIAGVLLDPTFINLDTGAGSMGATLLKLWQISRNLTNILLAFLLLIGAVMTVVFAEGGYVQKYAVKFVLAVVLVNFSWFFPRVILDLTNVLTATVYSIPSALGVKCEAYDDKGNKTDCMVLDDIEVNGNKSANPIETDWRCIMPNGEGCTIAVKEVKLDDNANMPQAIFGGLLWNHARLRYLTTLQGDRNALRGPLDDPGPEVSKLIIFTLTIAFTTFFSVMILFPLMALVLCLLLRIPIIWITVGFMPFMFIGLVAGDYLKLFNPMEIWKKFLAAAFLPVVVAIPFSIGFLMLNVAISSPPVNFDPLSPLLRPFNGGAMITGVENLWQLIWAILAAVVVWMGTKQAFKIDAVFEKFAGPIMNAGASWGKLVAKLPLLLPLPLPGAPGGVKPTGLQLAGILAHPETSVISGGRFHMPSFGAGAAGAAGPGVDSAQAATILDRRLRDDTGAKLTEINQTLQRLAAANDDPEKRRISLELRTQLNTAMGTEGSVRSTAEMKDIIKRLRENPALQSRNGTRIDAVNAQRAEANIQGN